jgi:hypothetical protein
MGSVARVIKKVWRNVPKHLRTGYQARPWSLDIWQAHRRAVKRAEGPAGNSPAREGGGLARSQVRGQKDRHFDLCRTSGARS